MDPDGNMFFRLPSLEDAQPKPHVLPGPSLELNSPNQLRNVSYRTTKTVQLRPNLFTACPVLNRHTCSQRYVRSVLPWDQNTKYTDDMAPAAWKNHNISTACGLFCPPCLDVFVYTEYVRCSFAGTKIAWTPRSWRSWGE